MGESMSEFEREYGAESPWEAFSTEGETPDPSWSRSRLSEETDASRELRAARLVYAGVRDAERVAAVIYGSIFRRIKVHVVGLENDLQWVSAVEAMWAAGIVVVPGGHLSDRVRRARRRGPAERRDGARRRSARADRALRERRDDARPGAALRHPAVPLRALVQS